MGTQLSPHWPLGNIGRIMRGELATTAPVTAADHIAEVTDTVGSVELYFGTPEGVGVINPALKGGAF